MNKEDCFDRSQKIYIPIITPLIGLTLVFVWSIYHIMTSCSTSKVSRVNG